MSVDVGVGSSAPPRRCASVLLSTDSQMTKLQLRSSCYGDTSSLPSGSCLIILPVWVCHLLSEVKKSCYLSASDEAMSANYSVKSKSVQHDNKRLAEYR
ncbi:hypothetical protein EYF80_020998 [Liparis tanakae]|uniref:Uncharacterized protein n=1 Tax=Liparis tanakae TaxID=230148 RepID=A0A4Z2HT31_9TELE|nr:hypothetical protein EYF80_020998 [Liparis tanakae]